MNKKLMLLPLFAIVIIGTVFALTYYGVFSTTLDVTQSIVTNDNLEQDLGIVLTGESYPGQLITIKNIAPSERHVVVVDNGDEKLIDVSYTSTLGLTRKIVDFNADIWNPLVGEGEATAVVEYTVVGDSFTAEVTDGAITGYALYYYADNDDRFANPNTVVPISEVSANLPAVGDENTELNDYSAEYPTTPHGAKIWYIPTIAETDGVIDWSQASTFLFETALVQYNADGEITIYPGQTLSLTPVYTPSAYVEGPITVTTEIL